MTDFATMDPREFVRGLMHGNRDDLKLGYTAENAVLAVCEMQGITDPNARGELLDYAQGFAHGMVDAHHVSPASHTWRRGFYDGGDTDCTKVYPGWEPAAEPVER